MSPSRSLFPALLLAWCAMAVGVHGCAAQRPASPTDDQAGQVVSVEHETRVHGTAPDHPTTADPAAAPAPIVETPVAPVAPPAFAEEDKLRVLDVRAATGDTGSRWVIELSRTPDKIHSFDLSSPRRCVIDVAGPSATSHGQQTLDTGDRMIPRLRIGGYTDHLRMVLEPAPEVSSPCIAETDGTAVVVALGDPPNGAEPHQVWSALSIPDGAAAHAAFVLAKAAPGSARPAADPAAPAVADAKTGASTDPTTTASAGDLTVSSPAKATAPEAAATKADPAPTDKDHLPPGSQPPLAAPAAPEESHDSHALTPVSMSGADARATAADQHLQQHYTGRRISLEFKDADIQNVLRIIADVAQKNIVATEDVKGRVTIVLRDLPWDQALDILLKSTGLEKVEENDVITVSTSKRLEEERKSRLAAFQAGQQLEPLQTAYIRVNYVKASDLEKIIRGPLLNGAGQAQGQAALNPDQLLGLLSRRGNVQTNEATNTLIVRDVADGIRNARELVRRLDVQTPEVLIESSIFEANTNFDRDLGVQWGAKYIASPETGNPTGRNFPGRVAVGGAGPLTGGA
ncbi:MAG TPA: secretin and TonB N-terminal domain-containing protein, partial [Candidatus Bathyarchaeia archaeon]|nr:secretin and TonB N-terminal domain-containing protein [Candidatus Bathyarchaeia archaeon]